MSYVKTEPGQVAFRERSALFSARQRAAYILFDGIKSTVQVLSATAGLGVTPLDIEQMVAHGFLKENARSGARSVATAPASEVPAIAVPRASPAESAPASASASASAASSAPVSTPGRLPGTAPVSTRTPQERYSKAKPMATQLTASLGLRGFMLNLGVESASGFDDLLALFPKIQAAVGAKKCEALERVLKG